MAWVPLESNPDVMNNFLEKLGVPKNVRVVDVYSLDPDLLAVVPQPVVALLLLFPCDDEYEEHRKKQEEELRQKGQTVSDSVFFIKQVVHNACGTIALIHSVANLDNLKLEDGFLKNFINEAKPLDPDARGNLLQKADAIIDVHKEVAAEGQTAPPDEREPVPYHFVAFVQKDGTLYELDGRKAFPVNHGPTTADTLLESAAEVCRQYMGRNPDNVNFTICAVTVE